MGDPLKHSQSSAQRFGGVADDYIFIHTVMDSSKLFLADWRHRALLHNTFGIHVFEQLMGSSFKRKSDGVEVCTRTVITQHIMEDLGAVPTPGEFLREMPLKHWMAGISQKDKKRMQTLTIEGENTKEAYISSTIKWILYKNEQPSLAGTYLVCSAENNKVSTLHYDPIAKAWDLDHDVKYWAYMPLHPIEL